ncbi:trehalose-phosphatase [Natronobeatus ordinarius]|uniref:trehalose-phosphatase n=1 Tax=Natronobeatus ordinarius TaxID=2963433 RepID=UPI0020CE3944|nr:trehalose-phosphatase [Natronobeatus ordinarius]
MSKTEPRSIAERLPALRNDLREASELLVCLDFDGTLAPIVDEPDDATPTPANAAALEALAAEESVSTAIVSGRALTDVRQRVDGPSTFAGNHGLELERDGSVGVHPVARERATLVEEVCSALEVALESIPGAAVENKRLTGTVHVRSTPPAARPVVERLTKASVERFGDDALDLSRGKRVLELGPSVPWGKGDAIELLQERRSDGAYTIYVGDDVTDESAFRAVEPDGLGVRVGDDRPTAASCRVASPTAVATLLRWLATVGVELLEGRTRRRSVAPALRAPGGYVGTRLGASSLSTGWMGSDEG